MLWFKCLQLIVCYSGIKISCGSKTVLYQNSSCQGRYNHERNINTLKVLKFGLISE